MNDFTFSIGSDGFIDLPLFQSSPEPEPEPVPVITHAPEPEPQPAEHPLHPKRNTIENSLANIERMAEEHTTSPTSEPAKPRLYTPIAFPLRYATDNHCTFTAHRQTQWWLNDLLHSVNDRSRWLVLTGNPGTGKSHLLFSAVKIIREFNRKVLCKRATELAASLREGHTHLLEQFWIPAGIMAIDDLGAEYHSEFISAQLFELLDRRIGKWTIITTNLNAQQIASRYDARLASRIFDAKNSVADLTHAPDYRQNPNR